MKPQPWLLASASAVSAFGTGLLLWLGISVALLQGQSEDLAQLRSMQRTALVVAGLLALPGFINLLALPRGKWRRGGCLTLALALACAATLAALLAREQPDPGLVFVAAALLAASAIATALAAGMAMTTDARDGWRSQMVAPNFLAFALLAGVALLFALVAAQGHGIDVLSAPMPSLVMLLVVVAALKLLYWFENGGLRTAAGSGEDLPRLRLAALGLLAIIPLCLAGALALWPELAPRAGWGLIVLSLLAGGCLERYLLAVEAGHMARGPTPG